MSKFEPTIFKIEPPKISYIEEQGFTLKGYIWAVSCSVLSDCAGWLTIDSQDHTDNVIDLEVWDNEIFDGLRPYMFTKCLIEFRGDVEVEQDHYDRPYNTYIVKSFEVISHET